MAVGLAVSPSKGPPPTDGPYEVYGLRAYNFTADTTLAPIHSGSFILNVGATGAIAYTLPRPYAGMFFIFVNAVGQNMTITSDRADTMITYNNNTTADGVVFSTSGQLIGAMLLVLTDGLNWYANNIGANTLTVNT